MRAYIFGAACLSITALSAGCTSVAADPAPCDQAAAALASCGKIVDESPFGTCQPEQRELAQQLVTTYQQQGCAALVDAKADSALCAALPAICVTHVVSELKPFVTDGCSMFPDGTPSDRTRWQHCCITHDFAYYVGGPAELRVAADDALAACVSDETTTLLGGAMKAGVRIGGIPYLPTPWRWGYGWRYDPLNGYRTIPADQLAAAQSEVASYQANPTPPDALEQRLERLWDNIVIVVGLGDAMQQVDNEVATLN